MKTKVQKLTGIPNDKVPDMVALIQADRRYLSHMVIPEGNGKSTIVAVFSVPASGKKAGKKKTKKTGGGKKKKKTR